MPISGSEAEKSVIEAKSLFAKKKYDPALEKFQAAHKYFKTINNLPDAAEIANNIAVCYMMKKDAKSALQILEGTDLIFEQCGDRIRQALALGNQASAYEDLDNPDKALELYEKSSDLLEQTGEKENRAIVLKRISAIQLKHGRQLQALATMNTALQVEPSPSSREKSLKKVLNIFFASIRPK